MALPSRLPWRGPPVKASGTPAGAARSAYRVCRATTAQAGLDEKVKMAILYRDTVRLLGLQVERS
ncbi:MAG TPA: hypothetical protein VMZ31_11825 [Phycisphaerae bacterium]|nr:hypothetical protein [Phycisphaerae bacterium]